MTKTNGNLSDMKANITNLRTNIGKMIMKTLTEIDRQLISALRENSRMSITELAAVTGVSRTTAKVRLETLVAEGRIRRFTIETDVEGEIRAITMVELQGRMSRTAIKTLLRIPEVTTVYSTNGTWDLVVEIKTDSLVNFDRVLRDIRNIQGVLNSETSLLLTHVTNS